jgi:hypothetical protein
MALPACMASRLKALLEEESEHQWLAIGVFFVFILVGAFAIGGTEHFVGDQLTPITAEHAGGLVMDIEYSNTNDSYTALVYAPNAGYHMFTEHPSDNSLTGIYDPDGVNEGRNVSFLKTMQDGHMMLSVENNELVELTSRMQTTFVYSDANGSFAIYDAAEDNSENLLFLTKESQGTSFRGTVGLNPTAPMSMTSGIQWQHIEAHSPGLWIGIGMHTTSGADGSSPASPEPTPAIGWITWEGDNQTPVMKRVKTFPNGLFHSIQSVSDGIVIGGTHSSIHVNAQGDYFEVDAPCTIAVADQEGSVWFIGEAGSSMIAQWTDGELRTHLLSKSIPISASVAGSQGDFVHFHGTNAAGEPSQWSIDIQANGSIENGRGFLNLLFILAGTFLLATMALSAFNKMREF